MPKLEELLNDKVKSKLTKMINTSDDIVKGTVVSDFVGQTPNLNSSLGVNAADGLPVTEEAVQDQSKLDTFFTKNANIISSGVDLLGGLFGSKPSATPVYSTLPPTEKSGMPWWAWVLIAVVVALIIYFIVKLIKK